MVTDDRSSKLCAHGFQFRNWPGAGEEAAARMGISHAVILPPNARTIIVAGQVGIRDDGTVSENLSEEVETAFEHVDKALKVAGLGDDAWEHIYKINTFEISAPGLMDIVLDKARVRLGSTKPAWVGVGVQSLFHPSLHIEISVEAYLPGENR
ncbi:YjgF-like protein [Cucurbitaria berberidis CBS 394.84]|uniref:YjgF-like protein n=1 Tax=Cucurbitaria berberidis CBS 394.84 TaxID=1168544 RepID=A0A9P4G917_9PLEO|nr:YjgF-like protein [Cucurbitaria berberidis CBS 394.84]KAF1841292.1 YjgF-like protein [Cucurbitaria berberidis CBS 394.84]